MKYIRTKDGIYRLLQYGSAKKHYVVISVGLGHKVIDTSEIIKQADTIKGLCDGFVITSKQGHIYDSYGDYGYELKEVLPQARKECPNEEWDLYGCILVNGIIKQVAKLNDEKGELELL